MMPPNLLMVLVNDRPATSEAQVQVQVKTGEEARVAETKVVMGVGGGGWSAGWEHSPGRDQSHAHQRHHWKQPANTVRACWWAPRAGEETATCGPTPEDPGEVSAQLTGSLLPLSQTLPRMEELFRLYPPISGVIHCFGFIPPFIEDLAPSTGSNQWNSWNERISLQKFYRVHELRIEISRAINQSLIYTLHQYLLREVEGTGFLFCLPSHCPSNYLSLGNQRCGWSDMYSTVYSDPGGGSTSRTGYVAVKICFLILNRMENPYNRTLRKMKSTNFTIKLIPLCS